MAQKFKREVYPGKTIYSNLVNDIGVPILGQYRSIEAKVVTSYWDGTPMTDAKVDNKLYSKINGEYIEYLLPNWGESFLEKDTMARMREISAWEMVLIKRGYYKGVRLNGYYFKGDTPAPIDYFLSETAESDNGGSVLAVHGEKLVHTFVSAADVRYFGAKGDGVTNDTATVQKAINALGTKSIIISDGIFPLNKFTCKNNLVIQGVNATTLRLTANITILDVNYAENVKIFDLNFDGNSTNLTKPLIPNNVELSPNGKNIFISGCHFRNLLGPAIAGGSAKHITVQDCVMHDLAQTDARAVYFSTTNSYDITINRVTAYKTREGSDVVAFKFRNGVKDVLVSNCKLFGGGYFGGLEVTARTDDTAGNKNITFDHCYGEVDNSVFLFETNDSNVDINDLCTVTNSIFFATDSNTAAPVSISRSDRTTIKNLSMTDVKFFNFTRSLNILGGAEETILGENYSFKNVDCLNINRTSVENVSVGRCKNVTIEGGTLEIQSLQYMYLYEKAYDVKISKTTLKPIGLAPASLMALFKLAPGALDEGSVTVDGVDASTTRLFTGAGTGTKNGKLRLYGGDLTYTFSNNHTGYGDNISYNNTRIGGVNRTNIGVVANTPVSPTPNEMVYSTVLGTLRAYIGGSWVDIAPAKASQTEVNSGTDNTKYVTPLAIETKLKKGALINPNPAAVPASGVVPAPGYEIEQFSQLIADHNALVESNSALRAVVMEMRAKLESIIFK